MVSKIHFHSGEQFIQEQAGEQYMALRNCGIISNRLTAGAISFIENQVCFYASLQDARGMVWASVLTGAEGFIGIESNQFIYLNPSKLKSNPKDIFWQNLRHSSGIGLLFIDLTTRQRFRVNGKIVQKNSKWLITIDQAYPNCPKYIQRRESISQENIGVGSVHDVKAWIARADTIFVASADGEGNLDVSHRGGHTGFVRFIDNQTLRIPDYHGNSMFNTLGNIHISGKAGILIQDFISGETLQLCGKATVHIKEQQQGVETGGTKRWWDFHIEQFIFSQSIYNLTSRFIDFSPFNP